MTLQRPLAESVVVLTGASSGIGAATATRLTAEGAAVVLVARREQALHEVAERCAGGRTLVVPADVADPDAMHAVAARAVAAFGRIDAWVNNAAIGLYAPLHEAPLAEVRRTLEVNLLGCLHGARAALPHLRAAGGGVVVNVSSVLGVVTVPYMGSYTMSKHAVRALSASLRQDLLAAGERRISVSTVLPASIDTPFYRNAGNHTGKVVGPLPPVYPPELVARTIVRTLRRPKAEVYAGPLGHVLAVQWSVAPRLSEWLLARYGRLALRGGRRLDTAGNAFTVSPVPPQSSDGWQGTTRTRARTAAVLTLAAAAAAGAGTAAIATRRRSG